VPPARLYHFTLDDFLWHSWHSWHCTLVFQISFWFTRLLQTSLQTSGWHSLTKRVMLQVSGKVTKNSLWMYCSYHCHVRALPLAESKKKSVIWIYEKKYIYIYIVIFIYLFIYSFICSYSYMNKSHVPGVKHQLRRNRRPFTIKRRSRMMRIRKTLTIRISRIKRQNLRTWWQSPQDMVIS
jgi:hypothetical protein